MENQIFNIKAGTTKSVVLRSDEIWLCLDKIKSLEKFEKVIQQTGLLKIAYTIPYNEINEVSFNESSQTITIKYLNKKGKEKNFKADFRDISTTTKFGNYLGKKLGLDRKVMPEGKVKPLLTNLIYLVIIVVGILFLTSIEDHTTMLENGSGRRRIVWILLYEIIETIGYTGIYIIGGLFSFYMIYDMFKRYNNPISEIIFSRASKISY